MAAPFMPPLPLRHTTINCMAGTPHATSHALMRTYVPPPVCPRPRARTGHPGLCGPQDAVVACVPRLHAVPQLRRAVGVSHAAAPRAM
eukprot:362388-Chlamydomonas_euryale.AAC.11